jgi:hypothetical protein
VSRVSQERETPGEQARDGLDDEEARGDREGDYERAARRVGRVIVMPPTVIVTGVIVTTAIVTGVIVTGVIVTGVIVTGVIVTGVIVRCMVVRRVARASMLDRRRGRARSIGLRHAGERAAAS